MKNIKPDLKENLSGETDYFNDLASIRQSRGVPCEADMRTETLYLPQNDNEEIIDAKLKEIILSPNRKIALEHIFSSPDGNILDVCCGPGWFCLEGARAGRKMVGYDISDVALAMAVKTYDMRKKNEGFDGSVTYKNGRVEDADLSSLNLSAAMGWSAFHHLADPGSFLDKLYENLNVGGIVVTMDDLDSDLISKLIRYGLKFILPVYEYTYYEKLKFIMSLLRGQRSTNKMVHSPMEIYADKHGAAADIIRQKLTQKFTAIYDREFGAFSIYVCHSLKGPAWWRHCISRLVVALDRFMISIRLVSGSYRIIVAKK